MDRSCVTVTTFLRITDGSVCQVHASLVLVTVVASRFLPLGSISAYENIAYLTYQSMFPLLGMILGQDLAQVISTSGGGAVISLSSVPTTGSQDAAELLWHHLTTLVFLLCRGLLSANVHLASILDVSSLIIRPAEVRSGIKIAF